MISSDNEKIYEIQCHNPAYGSYLINNSVQLDGRLFYATKIDPLFLILPVLRKMKQKVFMTIDNIVCSTGCNGYAKLQSCLKKKAMQLICDHKQLGSYEAYKLNETSVQQWLVAKASKISSALLKIGLSSGVSHRLLLSDSEKKDENPTTMHIAYSIDILKQYVSKEDIAFLNSHFNMVTPCVVNKENIDTTAGNDEEGGDEQLPNPNKAAMEDHFSSKIKKSMSQPQNKKLTAAERKRQKSMSGRKQKSLASFFN